jgi:hypothetical protein
VNYTLCEVRASVWGVRIVSLALLPVGSARSFPLEPTRGGTVALRREGRDGTGQG